MKKIIGLPLLLLASIIILVHAIIPHNHNGNEPFEHDYHDHDHNFPYHYSHKSDTHSHDEDFSEDCLLNDYLRISQDRQQNISSDDNDYSFSDDWGYFPPFAVALNHRIEIKDYESLPFWQKPYIAFSYNHYVTHSLGLRAPPVC